MSGGLEDFFAGGAAAAKFEDGAFGTVIGGQIMEDPRMTQQRDYTSGEPITYPDGNPAMQMVVVVQAYKPAGDDDGRRAFYIKGQMKQAVGEALRKVEAKYPQRGGYLWIKYTEDKPTTLKNGRPGNPQKIYAAKYDPPAPAAADYFDSGQAGPGAPPAARTDSRPAGDASDPRVNGLACPPGVDPARWGQMNPAQQAQMYDALGLDSGSTQQAPGGDFRDRPPF